MKIEVIRLETGRKGILVTDEENGIRVVSESFEVKENVNV